MADSFILWLHGLGDSGPANEPITNFFSAPEFKNTKWAFPTAPSAPVTCNRGAIMDSWFDISNSPITSKSVRDENDVLKAVHDVHAIVDAEIASGISPGNIFICGLSQGGAMAIASVLLYPKTLGGGVVFSGFVPFCSPVAKRVSSEARKTPILWCHGKVDTLVPFEAGQDAYKLIKQIGMRCEFKAYPDLGHSLEDEELRYFASWIKNRLGSSSEVANHKFFCRLFNLCST
ncbi:probable carboxylesterase Os04g0669500 isoform X1 [Typha angustifolia]|uniref:probable carboxylesterase Os04g0669500 isoform X1 n=1 Tax=Typha angustifolia TaxID=59011 RepID=UPI003C2D7303